MLPFLVEFIGTFVFLSVILWSGEAIPIGAALATAIFMGGAVSGGNFNPAVSTMMFLRGTMPLGKTLGYVVMQLLGAFAALKYFDSGMLYLTK